MCPFGPTLSSETSFKLIATPPRVPDFVGREWARFWTRFSSKQISEDHKIECLAQFRLTDQTPTAFINYDVLDFFKSNGLYENLRLDLLQQSVGDAESPLLYHPASLASSLVIPKVKRIGHISRPSLNYSDWQLALQYVQRHFEILNHSGHLEIHELRQALLDVLDNDSGSPGPAFNLLSSSKKEFVEKNFHLIEETLQNILSGSCPVAVWKVFLKEELRPFQKFEAGSTRIIWSCPITFFCVEFLLFYKLQKRFIELRDSFFSTCGLDFSGTEFAARFARVYDSDYLFADGSDFDASQTSLDISELQFIFAVFSDIPAAWQNFYDYVLANTVNSLALLASGHLISVGQGNPSGSFLTLMRNTFHNFRLFAYAYIRRCRRLKITPSYESFVSVPSFFNGDDSMVPRSLFSPEDLFIDLDFMRVTVDTKHTLKESPFCGVLANDWNGLVPIRDSRKFLISLVAMDNGKIHERLIGLLNANPFDDVFCSILYSLSERLRIPLPPLAEVRSRFGEFY